MVGNYLAVIALAGMVAEMVAILRWDIAEVSLNGQPVNSKTQKAMFWQYLRGAGSGAVHQSSGGVWPDRPGGQGMVRYDQRDPASLSPSVVAGP